MNFLYANKSAHNDNDDLRHDARSWAVLGRRDDDDDDDNVYGVKMYASSVVERKT